MTDRTFTEGDVVTIVYRIYDLTTNVLIGKTLEYGTVTRVWADGKTISIRTESGKLFMRNVASYEVVKV
jgi:hypothetical protein